jgi:anti-sigma factor RsiW
MAAIYCGESWRIMWKANNGACGRIARSLGEYLDGTLPLARRRTVEAHLHLCAGCRAELEAMRRTLALLAGMPRRELTEDFDTALQARLSELRSAGERQTRARGRRRFSLLPARELRAPWPSPLWRLAPAGALAAATLGVVAWRLQPPPAAIEVTARQTPAYVQMVVQEHQRLRVSSDLNATVVSHNLGADVLAEGEE